MAQGNQKQTPPNTGKEARAFWVQTMVKLADPILTNLSQGTLRKNMPAEPKGRKQPYSHLEAVGRLFCGLSPWLELGPDDTEEGKLREKYIQLALKGLRNAVDPESPDHLIFDQKYQPLVDTAFLAQGLLRAPTQLWGRLDELTQKRIIKEFKKSRTIPAWSNNWLFFASMVEAALLEFTGEYDSQRLLKGVDTFRDHWYKGDSIYGDGPWFSFDYYNSFVIHPMFTDVLRIMSKHNIKGCNFYSTQLKREIRYAEILERMISPEGTYPCVGRSITYRFGAFHALGHIALMHKLSKRIKPAQVRCALTAVIRNQLKSKENFDENGWLRIGFAGCQIGISEVYINTGSVYLCSVGLLPLGLPPSDPFWSAPDAEWTNVKAWSGKGVSSDSARHYLH